LPRKNCSGNHKRNRYHGSGLAAGLYKIGLFLLKVYFWCVMAALEGKAVKIGMQCGKLITDARF